MASIHLPRETWFELNGVLNFGEPSWAVILHRTRMTLTRCHLGWQLADRRPFRSGKIPNLSSPSQIRKSQTIWIANRMVWGCMRIRSSSSYCMSYEYLIVYINSIQFQSSPGWFEIFSRLGSDYDLPRLLPPDDVQTPVADDETEESSMVSTPGKSPRTWSLVDELTWVSLEPISCFTGKAWCFFLWRMAWSDLPKMDRFHVIPWTKTQTCPPKKVA